MMSNALDKLGRYAARRPWTVIGTWLIVSVLVVAAAGVFGQKLEDSMGAPGLDSQQATDLLARSDQAGLTAQLVVTPADRSTASFDSADARAALTELQAGAAKLPNVLNAGGPATISPDGRIAVIRLQYPVQEQLAPSDLQNLKAFAAQAGKDSPLRIELGGDLFFVFEQPRNRAR